MSTADTASTDDEDGKMVKCTWNEAAPEMHELSGSKQSNHQTSDCNCNHELKDSYNKPENVQNELELHQEVDLECLGDNGDKTPSMEEDRNDDVPKTLHEDGGQMGESSLSLESEESVSEDGDWVKFTTSDIEREQKQVEPSGIQDQIQELISNMGKIDDDGDITSQQTKGANSCHSPKQCKSVYDAESEDHQEKPEIDMTGVFDAEEHDAEFESKDYQQKPHTDDVDQQANAGPVEDVLNSHQHQAMHNANSDNQPEQKNLENSDNESPQHQKHVMGNVDRTLVQSQQPMSAVNVAISNDETHQQQTAEDDMTEPAADDAPQQHSIENINRTIVQPMSTVNIANPQPHQEEISKDVRTKADCQQQPRSISPHSPVQEQQNDHDANNQKRLRHGQSKRTSQSHLQCTDQQKTEKQKSKKKFKLKNLNPLRKLRKKQKSKDSESSSTERMVEPIASVSYTDDLSLDDNDSDVAKVRNCSSSSVSDDNNVIGTNSKTQRITDDSHSAAQESSFCRDRQLVTAGASSSSLDQESELQDSNVEEQVKPVIPVKKPAPRLDTSQRIQVTYKVPVRNTLAPKHSPTEQYYDILLIHSLKDDDLDEVDFIKKIGKRYAWKIISVEEFPAGMTKFEIFSTMLPRCTYAMLLLTTNFYNDVWCNHRYAACLTAAVENRTHQWSVIPIVYSESIYDTPLELTTIAGLQREARYFKKNLRSTVSTALRRDREETDGFPSEPSPPPSPSPPDSPVPEVKSQGAAKSVITDPNAVHMSPGEIFRQLKPELDPPIPVTKFFGDDDRFRKICTLLDLEHCLGRDYRLLAEMMGFRPGEIRSLAQESSPTARILEVFCIKNASKSKIELLDTILNMVTLLDQLEVKSLIENEQMVARFQS